MSNLLYLCEKPAQAKVLAKHIRATRFADGAWHGNGMAVVAAQGHLLQLSTLDQYLGKGNWKIADLPVLPQEWVLQAKEDARSIDLFNCIGRHMAQATHVVIATDPDEEGELIGRDLLNAHNFKGKVSRLWASALDTDGLRAALNHLQPLSMTDGYFRAANIRRKLDWLFGMNLSRAFSVKFSKTTHIGRVKTRLLSELVKRDRHIAAFTPTAFHSVVANLNGTDVEWQYVTSEAPLLDDKVISKLSNLRGTEGLVTSVLENTIEIAPPLPYSLSSLLADGASIGINLSDGNAAAQSLYLAGAISYPRTSSTVLPSADAASFAAHSAIVATGALPIDSTTNMTGIYNLVQQNLQIQSMGAATIASRTVLSNIEESVFKLHEQWLVKGKEGFVKAITPEHPLFANYKKLNRLRPHTLYRKGSKPIVTEVVIKKLHTEAPAPFNEASMLKMMTEKGVGTEATRVSAINGLTKDGVAVASALTDERGATIRAPAVIRSTDWAQNLASELPESMTGEDMSIMVDDAQKAARLSGVDLDSHLLHATKWMLWEMPKEDAVTARSTKSRIPHQKQ